MSESVTAEIIQFPTRAAAAEPAFAELVAPPGLDARLARALANLNDALTAQRTAMAAWKSALGDLRTVSQRLGTSVRSYNESLGRLNDRIGSLRTDAVKLEAWADDALSKEN